MAEENKKDTSQDLFNNLAEITPISGGDVDEDIEQGEEQGTLTDQINFSPRKSDTQVIADMLNPDLGIPYLNSIQMSRIMPDDYSPLERLMIKDLMRSQDMPLTEAVAKVKTALTIAWDGEGRIDLIRIVNRISELEERKKNDLIGA